jgi:hypothetical protein
VKRSVQVFLELKGGKVREEIFLNLRLNFPDFEDFRHYPGEAGLPE